MQHAECQLFVYVLLLMKLIDDGDIKNVSPTLSWLFSRPKTLGTLSSSGSTTLIRKLWTIWLPKPFTLPQSRMKSWVSCPLSGVLCSHTTSLPAWAMIRLVKLLPWILSSEVTFNRTSTNKLVASSLRRPSLSKAAITNTLGICITWVRSRQSSLSTQKPRQASSKASGKDQRLEPLDSAWLCRNFWLS